jgi:hypothetical protein
MPVAGAGLQPAEDYVAAMQTVDDLLEQAKRLPPQARKELRDKLDASLESEQRRAAGAADEGPYASLLAIAGTAHSKYPDVSVNKNEHLAEIHAGKPDAR